LRNVSVDTLSLIDDETVNRQIEVERLVVRIRDADSENLGRLNMMIAQLHGDHDVRERENPFRPYLLARSLHDVLRNMVQDQMLLQVLFDRLSSEMMNLLPGYYAAIREVFESSGIQTRLLARPSMLTRAQREMLAQQKGRTGSGMMGVEAASGAENLLPQNFNSRIMPGLQRMLELHQKGSTGLQANHAAFSSDQINSSAAFQDFVWQIFNRATLPGSPRNQEWQNTVLRTRSVMEGGPDENPSAPIALVSQLQQYQQLAARGQALSDEISPDQNQLFTLREKVDAQKMSERERVTIDMVALLFEFILQDEQIPADWRGQIGRLQIPFLKAALLAPDLLQQASHPARQLLNRIGSVAIGLVPNSQIEQALEAEIIHIVGEILEKFDKDMAIFSVSLADLERAVAEHLRNAVPETKRCIHAIEAAEQITIVQTGIDNALQSLLAPLKVDVRISDFLTHLWAKVLACAGATENVSEVGSDARYHEVLPELIWSVQEKQTPEERSALIRLLPDLVKRVKKGLELLRMQEEEIKRAMDQLVAVHTQVLRGTQASGASALLSLEELRRHFASLSGAKANGLVAESTPIEIPSAIIEAEFASQGISVKLDIESDAIVELASDSEWLMQMQPGICVQLSRGETYELARLNWVSTHHSLYMFKPHQRSLPVIYSPACLVKALRDGVIRPLEYAPLCDRAVESLLAGAEAIQLS
jgi:hypothetical protein